LTWPEKAPPEEATKVERGLRPTWVEARAAEVPAAVEPQERRMPWAEEPAAEEPAEVEPKAPRKQESPERMT